MNALRASPIARLAIQTTRKPLYSFIQDPPPSQQIIRARSLVGIDDPEVVNKFESSLAGLTGSGEVVTFASGRMAFYSLLKTLGVGHGDEIILPGFTCSVMVNAILRTGATPVFSDIESSTLGSNPESIKVLINGRTKMIVAQHSFGYPCSIEAIAQIARQAGVFLLEDCATTLGSTVNGRKVGDFGDASLFSTDHTKPINTIIGGSLYSKDRQLIAKLRSDRSLLGQLPLQKQWAIWRRMQLEADYRSPSKHWKLGMRDMLAKSTKRAFNVVSPFLDEDYLPKSRPGTYPYPSPLPSFLAFTGLEQTESWGRISNNRVVALQKLLSVIKGSPSGSHLPRVLLDRSNSIVPLRLAWADPNATAIKRSIRHFVTTEGTWFVDPIVATPVPVTDFGYRWGSCPIAESLEPHMVNIPLPQDTTNIEHLARLLEKALNSN